MLSDTLGDTIREIIRHQQWTKASKDVDIELDSLAEILNTARTALNSGGKILNGDQLRNIASWIDWNRKRGANDTTV